MYNAYEWMLYKRVVIRGDNGAQLNIDCVEPEKKKDKSGKGVKEWSDNYIDKEKEKIIIKLGEANKITVRFEGKYRYDYIMNEDQLLAFKEIAIIWHYLGSDPK